MASPQELARQELARRELARRELQKRDDAPDAVPDYKAMAQRVFGPDLDSSADMDRAIGRIQQEQVATPKKAARAAGRSLSSAASKTGVYAAGAGIIEGGVGLAKMYTENFKNAQKRMYDSMDLPVPEAAEKQLSSVQEWVNQWESNLDWYKRAHPEDFLQLEESGFKGVTKELFSNPIKLVKGAVQSLPLMLEGMLPGGVVLMASQAAGQHYMAARDEGNEPETAALRAWMTAVPEAAIERFTLGKKIGLFKNMKPVIQGGTRKVMWEMGKAYARGMGEEGSQTFNENLWRWVFTDRSTNVWSGVKEAAAMGGPLESIFSGVAMAGGAGKVAYVDKSEKIKRVNQIRETVLDNVKGDAERKEVNAALDKVVTDIEAGKYDQTLSEDEQTGMDYGLSPEQTQDMLGYAETRFQELQQKKNERSLEGNEIAEWKFLKDHRDDLTALIEQSTDPASSVQYMDPAKGKPVEHSRNQYKNMVMNMVEKLTQSDIERGVEAKAARDGAHDILHEAIIQVTGKDKSLKSLKGKQLRQVAQYMSDFAADGVISEDDWDNYVMVDGNRVKMRDVMEQSQDTVANMPPARRRRRGEVTTTKASRTLGRIKNFFFGLSNTPLYHVAKRLDGGDENGVYSQVLDKNIQNGHTVEAKHNRHVYDAVREGLSAAGLTESDLVRMSKDLDPIRSVLRRVTEHLPTKLSGTTQRNQVRLGNVDANLSWAELIDLYLISNQEDGYKHLTEGGAVIGDQETGAITPQQLADIRNMIEENDQAKAVADLFKKISNSTWRSTINETSQALDGRKIATIDDWWGLEVLSPDEVGGERKEFNVNLIENKSILHKRANSSRPLVVRDAFRRFSVFQGAIANYFGMAEPFRIARTVLNDKSLWDAYRNRGMQDEFDTAQKLLQHAQGTVHAKNILESVIDFIMPNTYRALLYYNPKVWMSQYTSVFNYGSYVSKKYMKDVFGSIKNVGNRGIWEEMLSTSDIAFERFHTGKATLELGVAGESDAVRKNILGKSSWGNAASWMLKAADMSALMAGWEAAKAEFADAQAGTIEGKSTKWWAGEDVGAIEEGTPEYYDVIRKRAEYLWQRTQPSWDVYNRSMITNAPKLMRSFLMFRSFHEKVLTMWNDAMVDYKASDRTMADQAEFAERVAWPVTSYMANATLRILIAYMLYGKRKDIEDVVKDTVLAPLDAFPVLGTILQDKIDALMKGLQDERVFLNNENLESMPLSLISDMDKNVTAIAYALGLLVAEDDKAKEELEKRVGDLVTKVSLTAGVPSYVIKNIAGRLKQEGDEGTEVYDYE